MTRHLADHRSPSDGGRVRHFLRLAREGGGIWKRLARAPRRHDGSRRVLEFLRIARGRSA
jgi:hypothetical protein